MNSFLGEFEAKLDDKKRIALPAGLKKQLTDGANRFVMNRSFDRCLNLYTWQAWQTIDEQLNKLNPFVKKERDFVRYIRGGATEVLLDTAGRLSLPRRLLDYANISSQMILLGHCGLIEIWDLAAYDTMLNIEPDDFSALAEEVMGQSSTIQHLPAEFDESVIVPIIRRR